MLRKIIILVPLLANTIKLCGGQCGKDEYKRCVLMADPLLKDVQLVYPDNLRDIDRVCRTWSQFVDCVKRYTDLCFTETKRKEFNKAVENPVDLVHQMCTSADYQTEYLKHAPCMRATLTDDSHCGRHYRYLVSQVSGEPATPALCCSHFKFRQCLLDQTQRSCNKEAYPFAKQILDKAMGFLQEQCSSYKPDQMDCPGAEFYAASNKRITQSWVDLNTARMSPEVSSWPDERRTTMRKYDWMTNTWTSSSGDNEAENGDNPRSGYSRGMSWNPSSTDAISWKVSASVQTDAWSPTVNITTPSLTLTSTSSNVLIDEPNQQGLSNANNHASAPKRDRIIYVYSYYTASLIAYTFIRNYFVLIP